MPRASAVLALALTVACTRNAPAWTTVDDTTTFELLGAEESVSMARVHLDPSETFRFAAGPCQEVMVLVERGVVRAELEWFEAVDVARFQAPTVVQAMTNEGADLFAVAVTHVPNHSAAPDWSNAPQSESCGTPLAPMTRTVPGRTGPFTVSGGRLSAQIYLDGSDTEAGLASLVALEGAADVGMAEQVHDSAEALFVARGSGAMRVGDDVRDIQPGTFVFIPAGTRHDFVPTGDQPLVAYQVYTPAGPEQRFRLDRSRER